MVICKSIACILFALVSLAQEYVEVPLHENLPRWRGFNLLEMFIWGFPNSGRFREEDFQLISQLGFDFVRLPLDYRFWIVDGDWQNINESAFDALDEALAFGERYNIHVCMNFHRAPGYTVAHPPEPLSLWESEEALRVCALHWRYFAKRYKGVPNTRLSFNLLNEPGNVDCDTYARVVRTLVQAIREEDLERLIIADGVQWGNKPCLSLIPLKVAQSARGYQPYELTHYQAEWFPGADRWPVPEWPTRIVRGGYLYRYFKREMATPLRIHVALVEPAVLGVTIGDVSSFARLVIKQEVTETLLFEESFNAGPGEGPWSSCTYYEEWKNYRCTYNCERVLSLPLGEYWISIEVNEGDWLTIAKIALIREDSVLDTLPIVPKWGEPNGMVQYNDDLRRFETPERQNGDWLWDMWFKDWACLRGQSVGVIVGEFGVYNKTPHGVALRWMEDMLCYFKKAGIGWALWNLRGPLGVLDSNRQDVVYEPYMGHQLDRKMLSLLQQY